MNDEHTTRRKTLKSPVFADRGLHGFFILFFFTRETKKVKNNYWPIYQDVSMGLNRKNIYCWSLLMLLFDWMYLTVVIRLSPLCLQAVSSWILAKVKMIMFFYFFIPEQNSAYDLKSNTEGWSALAQPTACYPYDPTTYQYYGDRWVEQSSQTNYSQKYINQL